MKIDRYGQSILNESDLCHLFLNDPTKIFNNVVLVDSPIEFNECLAIENIPDLKVYTVLNLSVTQFDSICQATWFMPKEYYSMDIAKWVLEQCTSEPELQRAGEELIMFQERDMFTLLQYLKYLVDVMRKNNIIWGVGRGSSVSSFVLFLIGIHRINSLHYQLSIDEFLK